MLNIFYQYLNFFRKSREVKQCQASKIIVTVLPEVITATYPDGTILSANIQNLKSFKVYTDNSGPWGADVWFVLDSSSGICRFPQGAQGEKQALDFILALPNFNHQQFIKAMGSTTNAVFLCWQKTIQ